MLILRVLVVLELEVCGKLVPFKRSAVDKDIHLGSDLLL